MVALPTLDYYDNMHYHAEPDPLQIMTSFDGDYYRVIRDRPRCSRCGATVYHQDGLRCPECD